MGADVRFVAGEGPEIASVNTRTALDQLIPVPMHGQSVAEAVSTARAQMNREGFNNTPLIGFAGAPFTVACYMIQGNGRNHDFPNVLHVAQSDPEFFSKVLDRITEATIPYLWQTQLFDSWAGLYRHQILTIGL
jgi:uroporphyrinogen decarboxylase